jgi:uncharacterized protein Yka (UPF0111/DUF47 family)
MSIVIRNLFFPKDKIFFKELKKLGLILNENSENMILLISSDHKNTRAEFLSKIKSNKSNSTLIYRKIFKELSKNLFTPYDREDIYRLSNSLRVLTNQIYKISRMLQVYNLSCSNNGIMQLSLQVKEIALLLVSSVNDLDDLKKSEKIIDQLQKINAIEHNVNTVYHKNLELLFHSELDFKELLKQNEVYQLMVKSINRFKDTSIEVESILVKYA